MKNQYIVQTWNEDSERWVNRTYHDHLIQALAATEEYDSVHRIYDRETGEPVGIDGEPVAEVIDTPDATDDSSESSAGASERHDRRYTVYFMYQRQWQTGGIFTRRDGALQRASELSENHQFVRVNDGNEDIWKNH